MDNEQPKKLEEITDEDLEALAGGYILDQGEGAGERRYMLIRDSNGQAHSYSGNIEDIQRQIDKTNACAPTGFVFATKGVITPEEYKQMYGRNFYDPLH